MKTPLGLLAAVLIIGSVQAQNLLKNGDFSDGLNGWNTSRIAGAITPGAYLKVEALPDAGGNSGKSARITDEDGTAGIALRQSVPAEAGKVYTLAFMSKTTVPKGEKGIPGYAHIQFLDAKGTWLKISGDFCSLAKSGKGWQAGTLTVTAPAGAAKMWVAFKSGNNRRGIMDVSDVSLTQSAP
jgi:hypothetical protein